MDFRRERVADLAARVRAGELSARELVQAALDRIEAVDGEVGAFVAVDGDAALADAAAIDDQVVSGEDAGPLAGIPLGVKDLEDAEGFRTTHGSPLHEADPPAAVDSELVARLKQAGCVVVGKTNTPEYGHKADTDNPVFGLTRNPWDLTRSAGGSSGGSGAALAAGMVPLCTGSDGGGSIRIPSAVCGLSGFKPSLGRIPDAGVEPPHWPDLSCKGPMARQVRDVALALDACIGPDPRDLRSLPMPSSAWLPAIDDPHAPRRVGWSPTLGYATVDAQVLARCEAALGVLEEHGTEVVEIETVWPEDPVWEWLKASTAYNLRILEEAREGGGWGRFDPFFVQMLELADGLSSLDVLRALDAGHALNRDLVRVFHEVDLLLTPTCAGQTPRAGSGGTVDGVEEANWVQLTYPFNLTRSPAGSVCAGLTDDGLPVGLQVVGPQHADVAVLRLMALLEDEIGFDRYAAVG